MTSPAVPDVSSGQRQGQAGCAGLRRSGRWGRPIEAGPARLTARRLCHGLIVLEPRGRCAYAKDTRAYTGLVLLHGPVPAMWCRTPCAGRRSDRACQRGTNTYLPPNGPSVSTALVLFNTTHSCSCGGSSRYSEDEAMYSSGGNVEASSVTR